MGASMSSSPAHSPVPSKTHIEMPPAPPASNPTQGSGASTSFKPSAVPMSPTDSGSGKVESVPEAAPVENGPGTYEELHRKCKEVFPMPFEGAKLVVNKPLSNHFQICHNLTMNSVQPGYKFGCTYIGTKQYAPTEAFPVLMGEIDASGNLNGTMVHQFTEAIRCRFVSQIQNRKCLITQLTSDYKGKDYTASLSCGNPDIVNGSGVILAQYLHSITKRVALGTELVYQYGPAIPGNQVAIYSLAGRYTADNWQVSSSLTPMAGIAHVCYYQKANDSLQVGVELEASLRTQECTTTVGYQLDLPKANVTFRGQVDSNWCVGAVMEKKLLPLPFTFALSAFANHTKPAYRFGVGLVIG